MPRPLPMVPRGPRRRRSSPPQRLVLGCPRLACDWEFAALRALVKPQVKGAVLHRPPSQRWPSDGPARVQGVLDIVQQRLDYAPPAHFPEAGDFLLVIEIDSSDMEKALGLLLLLSQAFPGIWFTLGRLFVRDRRLFRTRPGRRFQLMPANNVHLTREIRARLRGAL